MLALVSAVSKVTTANREPLVTQVTKETMVMIVRNVTVKRNLRYT